MKILSVGAGLLRADEP